MGMDSKDKIRNIDRQAVIDRAKEVLKIEADGILKLVDRIDTRFVEMIEMILNSTGRLIISGIGKSGIVGRKIVATLNSTGTRAIFLHPVEAMHGDLGQVGPDDIFVALSNSGETDELNIVLPSIQRIGCKVIAFTGNSGSTLATHSNIVIDVGVEAEACPLGLAPTASTTALLAIGDAMAVVLLEKKQFKPSDYKMYHPGGALGQRLASKVADLMLTGKLLPVVQTGTMMSAALEIIDRSGLGATLVASAQGDLAGIITDGDVRRTVVGGEPIAQLSVEDVMTRNPRRVSAESPTYDALNVMEKHQITVLPVTDDIGKILGILHLHDILGKGEFKFNGR